MSKRRSSGPPPVDATVLSLEARISEASGVQKDLNAEMTQLRAFITSEVQRVVRAEVNKAITELNQDLSKLMRIYAQQVKTAFDVLTDKLAGMDREQLVQVSHDAAAEPDALLRAALSRPLVMTLDEVIRDREEANSGPPRRR